jgi:hypothetical protein
MYFCYDFQLLRRLLDFSLTIKKSKRTKKDYNDYFFCLLLLKEIIIDIKKYYVELIMNKEDSVCYVTAYLNIERDKWSNFSRNFDTYLEHFSPFIKLFQKTNCDNDEMIVFIDEKYKKIVTKIFNSSAYYKKDYREFNFKYHIVKYLVDNEKQTSFGNYDNNCAICLTQITKDTCVNLNCGHFFHFDCIYQWYTTNKICPTCRTPIEKMENCSILIEKNVVKDGKRSIYKSRRKSRKSKDKSRRKSRKSK